MDGAPTTGNRTIEDRMALTQAHGSPAGLRRPSGPDPMAPIGGGSAPADYGQSADYRPTVPCHVWVSTDSGTNPGLLLEWRKPDRLPWEGRVVHTRLVDGRWKQISQWIAAGAIKRA